MKRYNGYTDEELDHLAGCPGIVDVITSDWFAAWLKRRDEKRDERKRQEELRELKRELAANIPPLVFAQREFTKDLVIYNAITKEELFTVRGKDIVNATEFENLAIMEKVINARLEEIANGSRNKNENREPFSKAPDSQ